MILYSWTRSIVNAFINILLKLLTKIIQLFSPGHNIWEAFSAVFWVILYFKMCFLYYWTIFFIVLFIFRKNRLLVFPVSHGLCRPFIGFKSETIVCSWLITDITIVVLGHFVIAIQYPFFSVSIDATFSRNLYGCRRHFVDTWSESPLPYIKFDNVWKYKADVLLRTPD